MVSVHSPISPIFPSLMGSCELYWPFYQNLHCRPDWKGCCRQFWRGSDFLFTTLETALKDTHTPKTASCLQTLFFSCLHLQKPFASGYVAAQIAIVKTFPSPPTCLYPNASWHQMFTFHEWLYLYLYFFVIFSLSLPPPQCNFKCFPFMSIFIN